MFEPSEIKIEWWPPQPTKGMLTGSYSKGIKITHIESGTSVTFEKYRNQHHNKQGAMSLLEEKLK
jgi:protein subunit release factor A